MTGLVGWWPLHENSGSTARDLSGNGNHGSLNGGVTQGVAGKGGLTAYSFDGEDDYIRTANSVTGINSISFWIYASDTIDNGSYTESHDGAVFANSSADYPIFWLGSFSSNTTGEVLNFYTDGKEGVYTKNHSLQGNKWHHIVINNQNGSWKIYVNNEKIDTEVTGTPPDKASFSNELEIGARTNRSQYGKHHLTGIRFYNRALSPQEIQTLYDWGSGDYTDRNYHDGSDPGAVSRWNFDGDVSDSWGSNDGADKTSAGFSSDAIRGQSKNFDGSGDYIDTTINSLQAPFSFFAWIRTNSASKRQTILSNYNASNDDFQFEVYDTGEVRTWGDQLPSVIKRGSISGKEWYHTGVVISSNGPKLFVNGKQVESDQSGNVGEISQNTNFYIGTKPNNTGDLPFDGGIDDARLYNRALSPSEVFQLYQWGTRGRDMRKLTVN